MALGEKIRQLDEQVAAAVRRALDDVRDELKSGLEQAVDDLRGRLSEVSPELPESFFTEEALRQLAEETAPASEQAVAEATAQGRAAAFGDLRQALEAIDRARGQTAILGALVAEAARFADRTAVLLLRPEGLVGWVARGFEADDAIRSATVIAQAQGWSDLVQAESPTLPLPPPRCAQLVSQLDSPVPEAGVIIPLILRDRVSAVVYADRTAAVAEGGKLEIEALQTLTYATALALETLSFREREATTTLAPALATPESAEPEPAVEAPAAAEAPADEPPAVAEDALPEPDEGAGATFEAVELESVEDAPPAPGTAAAESEVDDGWSTEPTPVEEVEELPVETMEELELDDEVSLEPPADDRLSPVAEVEELGGTEELELVDEGEISLDESGFDEMPPLEEVSAGPATEEAAPGFDEPVEEYELDLDEEPAAPSVESAPPPTSTPPEPSAPSLEESGAPTQSIPWQTGETAGASGPAETESDRDAGAAPMGEASDTAPPPPPQTPEAELEAEAETDAEPPAGGPVEPPADVQGPGLAFAEKQPPASASDSGDDAAHDEARRLARLLVSEIQLYNQEEVAEGRRNQDIYERLKDDIDRSRQLYEERVDPGIRESTDYFYQELVRQLGAGDSKTLGI